MRRTLVLLASLCALTTSLGAAPRAQSLEAPQQWREIRWPFPRDAWPSGKAFTCIDASCGGGAVLSVRVKIGFCNCDTGIRDDDEVDNVADVDMVTPDFVPSGPGEAIRVANFPGRIRSYGYNAEGKSRTALGLALARKCDLIAISVNSPKMDEAALRRKVVERLQSPDLLKWINRQLGEK